jgi:cellulose synthase operon protein C
VQGRPQDALAYLPHHEGRDQSSAQTMWNRALALRDLQLPHAAARAFQVVAGKGEKGWGREAEERARSIAAEAAQWQKRFDEVLKEGRALVTQQQPPSAATMAGQRDFVRLFFYDSVRSAGNLAELRALLPVAQALDRSYGGQVLTHYVQRIARADFARRGPLALRFRAYAVNRWQNLDAGDLQTLLADLRRADQPDMLIGALLATKTALDDVEEFTRMARGERDPWLSLAADEVAAEHPGLPLPEREALLKRAIQRAIDGNLELRRMRLEKLLIEILIQQHRSQEAMGVLSELRVRARRLDDVTVERMALQNLVTVAHLRRQRPLLWAYAEEVLLLPRYPCLNRRAAAILLAQDAVLAGELAAARERLKLIPSCSDAVETERDVAIIHSELARRGSRADAQLLHEYLVAGPPQRGQIEQIFAKVLEQRAVVRNQPTPAKLELACAIERLEAMPDEDEARNLARLLAYRALIFQALEEKDYRGALDLLVRERQTQLPDGCALGISAEPGRLAIVARTGAGEHLGSLSTFAGEVARAALPDEIKAKLSSCAEVMVVAEPAFHAQSRLLDGTLAWSFREGGEPLAPAPPGFAQHVAITDVEPPGELKLDPLPPWRPPAGLTVHRHLTGAVATPARVLASLGQADLIQFYVHGLMDARMADAALLVLSPSTDGDYALTAQKIRQTKLAGRPIVILAACEAADIDINYNPQWSLPVAFLKARARGVFAASVKLPAEGARAFFGELSSQLADGISPARALRDLRLSWRDQGAGWVDDVLLFQ